VAPKRAEPRRVLAPSLVWCSQGVGSTGWELKIISLGHRPIRYCIFVMIVQYRYPVFVADNRYIYFTRDMLVELNSAVGGEKTTWHYDLRDNATSLVQSGLQGDLRRGQNGNINVAGINYRTLDNFSQDPEGDISLNTPGLTISDTLLGSLSMQSHKIYQDLPVAATTFSRILAEKEYEINDHLGNVCVVVSDRKSVTISGTNLYDTAVVLNYNNYYPFGMQQVGRTYTGTAYRYGFNGKELDQENNGDYDYGFRIYDPRLARFLSVDPLSPKYAMLTPYQFASNTPIQAIDLDGLEARYVKSTNADGSTLIEITVDVKIINNTGTHISDEGMENYAKAIKKQIEKSYSKEDKETKTTYKTTVKPVVVPSADPEKDFYIEMVDVVKQKVIDKKTNEVIEVPTNYSGLTDGENTEKNRFQVRVNLKTTMYKIARTAAHEIGHGAGLTHPSGDDREGDPNSLETKETSPGNLMRQNHRTLLTEITTKQLRKIVQTIDKNGGGSTK
jgi:RHS repeat-associated protein